MKKNISILLGLVMCLAIITGCDGSQSTSLDTQKKESNQSSTKAADIAISSGDLDFLTDEQKKILNTAREYYFEYFAYGPIGFIELPNAYDAPKDIYTSPSNVQYDIIQATGDYAKWSDFMGLLRSVFTDECIDGLINSHGEPMYIHNESNGYVYFMDGGVGANIFLVGPDTYELTSKDENRISFDIIGKYDYQDGNGIVTENYPMELVKTEAGWRVSVITSTEIGNTATSGQEQYHVEVYEEELAVVEYISVTGMPDEKIQIKLNDNIKDFFLWQWLYRAPDAEPEENYYMGSATYCVVGNRYLSVVRFLDIYSDEHPVNGNTGNAPRTISAQTFDLLTGEPAEDLVYGGAAYTMGNAVDAFSQVYPDIDDPSAKSKFHDMMQSRETIYNYYLTDLCLAVFFENDEGDSYYIYEAPYDMIGELLAEPLSEALKYNN